MRAMGEAPIERLLDGGLPRHLLWRGRDLAVPGRLPSGSRALDRVLGGGWPRGALSELLSARGLGAALLLPALTRLSRDGGWIAWVAPPGLPFLPRLARAGIAPERLLCVRPGDPAEGWWAAEELLRSGDCCAVLLWTRAVPVPRVRRLQLAAEAGGVPGFLFRPLREAQGGSPAALRLRLQPRPEGLEIEVFKCRGGVGGGRVVLARGME